jgi:phosphopantetheinyl transferase (holo-ACP synthase)
LAEKLLYFYDIWTLKESYIKAWGKGMFEFELIYNSQVFEEETMASFSINYIDNLKQIINHVYAF